MAPHREKEIARDATETLGNVFYSSDMHSGKQLGQRHVCGHVEGCKWAHMFNLQESRLMELGYKGLTVHAYFGSTATLLMNA